MNYDRIILEMQNEISLLKEETSTLKKKVAVLEQSEENLKQDGVSELPTSSKKYRALSDYLSGSDEHIVSLTFSDIEELLGFTLPHSARQHRAFWANTTSHSIASSWLSVGYETVKVNIEEGNVVFEEKRREQFDNDTLFEKLLNELLQKANAIPAGTYNIRQIFGDDWFSINRDYRPSLGRVFYQYVVSGKVKYFTANGIDESKTQLYVKEGD